MKNRNLVLIIGGIVLLAATAFTTYSIVMYYFAPQTQTNSDKPTNSGTPKPSVVDAMSFCPLNGKKYTVSEQVAWEQRRPVAVMIENHPESRPQSGLTSADVVYESVAEGGITRFMGVFLCETPPQIVGPVRSARTYYLDWLSEYDALYAHVGGANTEGPANALKQLRDYGLKDMDQMSAGIAGGYYRDENRNPNVALEHTMYLDIEKLRQYAKEKFNWGPEINSSRWDSTFEKWKFVEQGKTATIPTEASSAATIAYDFWDNFTTFSASWKYDTQTQLYSRTMAGQPHVDKNNNKQITARNVIIMLQEESRANDGYPGNVHLLYKTTGTGEAYVFMNGKSIKATWSKSGRTARTKFFDANKKEIELERGQIWISVVPTFSKQSLKIQ